MNTRLPDSLYYPDPDGGVDDWCKKVVIFFDELERKRKHIQEQNGDFADEAEKEGNLFDFELMSGMKGELGEVVWFFWGLKRELLCKRKPFKGKSFIYE